MLCRAECGAPCHVHPRPPSSLASTGAPAALRAAAAAAAAVAAAAATTTTGSPTGPDALVAGLGVVSVTATPGYQAHGRGRGAERAKTPLSFPGCFVFHDEGTSHAGRGREFEVARIARIACGLQPIMASRHLRNCGGVCTMAWAKPAIPARFHEIALTDAWTDGLMLWSLVRQGPFSCSACAET
jgi:hypothetical protein